MPTIRRIKGAKGTKYQCVVRRLKINLYKVFWRKAEAERWGRDVEDAISKATKRAPFDVSLYMNEEVEGVIDVTKPSENWTLRQCFELYADTKTLKKKGYVQELKRIKQWLSRPLADQIISDISSDDLQEHVKNRLSKGLANSTIRNETLLISAVFRYAIEDWKLDIKNPVKGVKLPKMPESRDARLQERRAGFENTDEQRLLEACLEVGGKPLANLCSFAIETGMRQGELLRLTNADIFLESSITLVKLEKSKNNFRRRIVMSERAKEILNEVGAGKGQHEKLFAFNVNSLRHVWKKAREKAGLPGLHFHDLRHEALSRMSALGLSMEQLKAQSGHRTTTVLMQYLNARSTDIVKLIG